MCFTTSQADRHAMQAQSYIYKGWLYNKINNYIYMASTGLGLQGPISGQCHPFGIIEKTMHIKRGTCPLVLISYVLETLKEVFAPMEGPKYCPLPPTRVPFQ